MAGIIKVDEIEKSSDLGTGVKLNSPLLNSSGTEIMSGSGSITIPSGQSIRNSSGTEIISAAGALSSSVIIPNFVGMVAAFAMSTAPTGWLPCNGGELLIEDYQDLYDIIGTTWDTAMNPTSGSAHSTPASGNFRLPDFRGSFLRGVGTALNKDATSLAGYQGEKTKKPISNFTGSMAGTATTSGSSSMYSLAVYASTSGDNGSNWYGHTPWRGNYSSGNFVYQYPGYGHTHSVSVSTSGSITGGGDDETRPLNFGVLYCIKY